MIIAIDGTLASGKGTLARGLAAHYGLPHLDTGRLYRATALAALQAGVNLGDAETVAALARGLDLTRFRQDANPWQEADLRTAEVSQAASQIAVLPDVRAALLDFQRTFAGQPGGAVLDGRDIGTVVCPHADVKLWIDAPVEIRANRRLAELQAQGVHYTLQQMLDEVKQRDARDQNRADAPMKAAPDAVLINTGSMRIDEAIDQARAVIETALARKTVQASGDE